MKIDFSFLWVCAIIMVTTIIVWTIVMNVKIKAPPQGTPGPPGGVGSLGPQGPKGPPAAPPVLTNGVSSFLVSDAININDPNNQINYYYSDVSHMVSYRFKITTTLYPGNSFALAEVHAPPGLPMRDLILGNTIAYIKETVTPIFIDSVGVVLRAPLDNSGIAKVYLYDSGKRGEDGVLGGSTVFGTIQWTK